MQLDDRTGSDECGIRRLPRAWLPGSALVNFILGPGSPVAWACAPNGQYFQVPTGKHASSVTARVLPR